MLIYTGNTVDLVDRDSVVGKAILCGLDGREIQSRGGRDTPLPSRPPWDPPSLLYNRYRVSLEGVKRPGRGVDHQPTSSAEIEERVVLFLYSSSGPSWSVPGEDLHFTCILYSWVWLCKVHWESLVQGAMIYFLILLKWSGYVLLALTSVKHPILYLCLKVTVFLDMEPCSLIENYHCFGEICWLLLQYRRVDFA